MQRKSCHTETLARSEVCSVEYCRGCAVFHVNLGAVTLHFRPSTFRVLCTTLNTALARFRHVRPVLSSYASNQDEIVDSTP
ncbi:conserved protein of unknown function [Methylocaldum szegediense]|uniref:Uncharacterized protein n=1 Tax=Methylocaldum szegediense TaxID=73780 RepID=A0ABM9HVZ7_9GAMM|nr:conserved protein of unknown function [Methylocaldum szegediense]